MNLRRLPMLLAMLATLAVGACAATAPQQAAPPPTPTLRNPSYTYTEGANLVAGCDGGNRIYISNGISRMWVVPNDPQCTGAQR